MASDEPARKKRGADNQLTQDIWQTEDGDDDAEVRGLPRAARLASRARGRRVQALKLPAGARGGRSGAQADPPARCGSGAPRLQAA